MFHLFLLSDMKVYNARCTSFKDALSMLAKHDGNDYTMLQKCLVGFDEENDKGDMVEVYNRLFDGREIRAHLLQEIECAK